MHERKKNSFISILERVRADTDVSRGEGGGRGKMKWIRGSNKFSSRIGHWTLIDQCICDIWGDQGPKQSFQRITFKTFKLICKHKIKLSQIYVCLLYFIRINLWCYLINFFSNWSVKKWGGGAQFSRINCYTFALVTALLQESGIEKHF